MISLDTCRADVVPDSVLYGSRARETFEEALLMGREKHWNACFYAVTALLVKDGLSSSKHSGVKSFFNKFFIKLMEKREMAENNPESSGLEGVTYSEYP